MSSNERTFTSSLPSAYSNTSSTTATMVDMIRDCNWADSPNDTRNIKKPTVNTPPSTPGCVRSHHQDVSDSQIEDDKARQVFSQFDILRKRNELCDVEIHVGQRTFSAHRVVLAAHSPYFHAMFTRELSESRQRDIRIHEIDESAMQTLIDYCYTSNLHISESNVQNLLPAACLFQINEVQRQCCEFLKKQIDPSNCLEIRAFADTHSCNDLLRFADQYAQDNFNQVKTTEEFLHLDKSQLIDIISSDDLSVCSEEDVYSAVIKWIEFDVDKRSSFLSELLQYVRLPLMKPKFLIHTVSSNDLIRRSHSCRDLVDEAKNYLLLPSERDSFDSPRIVPRSPTGREEHVIFVVGGWCTGDAISTVEALDYVANEWKMMASMAKSRCGVGVGVLNNILYAVGGHDGVHYLNTVERYDAKTNIWSLDVAPTSSCRTSVGVAVLDDCLYAVGGQDGVSCLNVVERYDPNINRWTKISGLNNRRLGAAVTVSYGDDHGVYAIGGSDGVSPLGTVEFFDPRVGRWFIRASMTTRRKHLGAAAFNNYIYAVGGRDHTAELCSVERYSARMDMWTPTISMNTRRSGVSLAVLKNSIMAIGGFDGTNYLNSVEIFTDDIRSREWKTGCSMNHRRLGSGVGILCYNTNDLSRSMTFA